jgi:hypothetical protein
VVGSADAAGRKPSDATAIIPAPTTSGAIFRNFIVHSFAE